jgi:hypothetical protein
MNYHQSLMTFIINFFCLFASALALFLASLYAKDVFLFLFPKRSGFLFSLILPQLFFVHSFIGICRFFPKGLKNPDA